MRENRTYSSEGRDGERRSRPLSRFSKRDVPRERRHRVANSGYLQGAVSFTIAGLSPTLSMR